MAYRNLNQNLKALLLADTLVKSVVGSKVFLGQAREGNLPPLVWFEPVMKPVQRSEAITFDSFVTFHCVSKLADDADQLAMYVQAIFDSASARGLFDIDGVSIGGVKWVGDYTLTPDPVRSEEGSLVFDAALTYQYHLTRARPA